MLQYGIKTRLTKIIREGVYCIQLDEDGDIWRVLANTKTNHHGPYNSWNLLISWETDSFKREIVFQEVNCSFSYSGYSRKRFHSREWP